MKKATTLLSWLAVGLALVLCVVLVLREAYAAEEQLRPFHWTGAMGFAVVIALAALAAALLTTAAWAEGWVRTCGDALGSNTARWGLVLLIVGGALSLLSLSAIVAAVAGASLLVLGALRRESDASSGSAED